MINTQLNQSGSSGQLSIDFVQTRARRRDPQTSKEAGVHAATLKAHRERAAIKAALVDAPDGLTAREIATITGMDYIECQRRKSEVIGIYETKVIRDRQHVWKATA